MMVKGGGSGFRKLTLCASETFVVVIVLSPGVSNKLCLLVTIDDRTGSPG